MYPRASSPPPRARVSSLPSTWVSLTGSQFLSLLQTDDMSVFWVMEHTVHSLWLLLFYNVSNLQVLECLPLTLSGSLSYFRVNKSCFRHCTEQIQFVFMKNSTRKMGSIVYWLRAWALEPDSLWTNLSFIVHWWHDLGQVTTLLQASASLPVKYGQWWPSRVFMRTIWKIIKFWVFIKQIDIHFLRNHK